MPEICLAAEQHPSDMQLWVPIHCGSCNDVPHGGFPTIRHNEIQDITSILLTEVCHNVATEPPMEQPLTGETLTAHSANSDDNVRLDIRAGTIHRMHFWMYGVFYLNTPSNCSTDDYRKHKQAKKREYGQRVQEVECVVFTPLVLSSNGGMGKEATIFYERLPDMIAPKRQHRYSMVMGWLRCWISFASLRSNNVYSWQQISFSSPNQQL